MQCDGPQKQVVVRSYVGSWGGQLLFLWWLDALLRHRRVEVQGRLWYWCKRKLKKWIQSNSCLFVTNHPHQPKLNFDENYFSMSLNNGDNTAWDMSQTFTSSNFFFFFLFSGLIIAFLEPWWWWQWTATTTTCCHSQHPHQNEWLETVFKHVSSF